MKLTEKKLNTKSILLISIILPVLVIIISSIAITITAKSVQPGETLDMSLLKKISYAKAEASDEALSYLKGLTKNTVEKGIAKYDSNIRADITKIECGDKNTEKLLEYLTPSLSGKFTSFYENTSVNYGGDVSRLSEILPSSAPSEFTQSEENGTVNTVLTYNQVTDNMYFLQKDTSTIQLFIKENEGVFSSVNEKLIPAAIEYSYSFDIESNRLSYVCCKRVYEYSSSISFVNTLSELGTTSFLMNVTVSEEYNISYAGISIEEDELTLTKDGYDTLTVVPFTEANLSEDEYSLSFTSSDEGIATVDENGQVTAVKESQEPVIITVTLNYLGQTFMDSCIVYVVTPVEKVTVSDTALSLKEGEVYTISAEAGPSDATNKKVDFVSSDESIVTVTEDGKITAIKTGTATVYAYAVQGYVAVACTVTVTK